MEYRRFGNTGISVSPICLGAMTFGQNLDEKESTAIVHEAMDRGINFIDTADAYVRGRSEEVLGKALAGGRRDKVILATKCWVKMYDDVNGRGCSRRHVLRACEDSLRRLETDYIDLYMIHHPDHLTPVEETLSTVDALVKQGKIRYFGVSNHYAWQMAHMLGVSALHNWEPLVHIQCRYNIIDRVVENETVPFCREFNIAMQTYSPQGGGLLTGKYRRGQPLPEGSRAATNKVIARQLTEEVFDLIESLEPIAERNDLGLNQLAVLWVLAKPWVTAPILGGTRREHFTQVFDIMDRRLPDEDVAAIDELSEAFRYQPFVNQPVTGHEDIARNWW